MKNKLKECLNKLITKTDILSGNDSCELVMDYKISKVANEEYEFFGHTIETYLELPTGKINMYGTEDETFVHYPKEGLFCSDMDILLIDKLILHNLEKGEVDVIKCIIDMYSPFKILTEEVHPSFYSPVYKLCAKYMVDKIRTNGKYSKEDCDRFDKVFEELIPNDRFQEFMEAYQAFVEYLDSQI